MEGDHPWTSGIYKTVDAGKSWKLLPAISGKAVWSLALWPMKPDVIAAGTEDGVYQSLDAGANWTLISAPGNPEFRPVVSLAFDPANRAEWAEGLRIPTFAECAARGETPEVLFWVGCMGSFDARSKKVTVSFARMASESTSLSRMIISQILEFEA